mgnify:CR=1 FL=1
MATHGASLAEYLDQHDRATHQLPRYVARVREGNKESHHFLADDKARAAFMAAHPDAPASANGSAPSVPTKRVGIHEIFEANELTKLLKALARAGLADRARALVARYRTDVTDTALRRWKEPALHHALGEVALAANLPREALAEFRRSDLTTDGSPASECAACVAYDLGRAFDAAGQRDTAAVMFERYLATPYYQRSRTELDPTRVPAIRERLGQIYDALGKPDQAAPHHRAFIALWKNADAELQPRVAEARRRLAKAQKGQG